MAILLESVTNLIRDYCSYDNKAVASSSISIGSSDVNLPQNETAGGSRPAPESNDVPTLHQPSPGQDITVSDQLQHLNRTTPSAQESVPSLIERLRTLDKTLGSLTTEASYDFDLNWMHRTRLSRFPPSEADRAKYFMESKELRSFLNASQSSMLLVTGHREGRQKDVALTSVCAQLEDELRRECSISAWVMTWYCDYKYEGHSDSHVDLMLAHLT